MVFRLPFLFPQSWASFSLFFDKNWKMPLVWSIHWIQDAISGLHRDSWRYSNSRSFFLPKTEENNVMLHHGSTQSTFSGRICWVTTELKVPLGLVSLLFTLLECIYDIILWDLAYCSFKWNFLCWGSCPKCSPSLEKGSMEPLYPSLLSVMWSFFTVKSWLLVLC